MTGQTMIPFLLSALALGLAAAAHAPKIPPPLCNFNKTTPAVLPKMLELSAFRLSGVVYSGDGVGGGPVSETSEVVRGTDRGVRTGGALFRFNGTQTLWVLHQDLNCTASGDNASFPLGFDPAVVRSYPVAANLSFSSFKDLLKLALLVPAATTRAEVALADGMAATRWIGCLGGKAANEPLLELTFVYADTKVLKFSDPNLGDNVPLRAQIRTFEANGKTQSTSVAFEFSELTTKLTTADTNSFFTPPLGAICPLKSKATLPPLPESFVASLTAVDGTRSEATALLFDGAQRVVAFDVPAADAESLFPFATGAAKVGALPRTRLVVDARNGHTHVFNTGGSCLKSANISTELSGVFRSKGNTSLLELRPATDMLLSNRNSSLFRFQGEFTMHDGQIVDVFAAQGPKIGDVKKSMAVFVSKGTYNRASKWTSSSAPAILQIINYKLDPKTQSLSEESRLRLSSLSAFNKTVPLPASELSIMPCLRLKNTSYVYFRINHTLSAIQSFGEERFLSGLKSWVGTAANVTSLRVDNFYLKEAAAGVTMVFLSVGQRWSAAKEQQGAHTVDWRAEANLTTALGALNASLAAGFKLANFESKELVVKPLKESLRVVPDAFHPGGPVPPPPAPPKAKAGYTGGSMAVLAFCMLLIGGTVGVVLAFFLWKRNRGIAYQVYE